MASLGKIKHNQKRKAMSERSYAERQALKKQIKSDISIEEKLKLIHKLDKNPNRSAVRYRRRCSETGRPRAIMYGDVSRIIFRERANKGELPGIKKASW